MTRPDDEAGDERLKLVAETARIHWRELQRFFAQGRVIGVDPALDLVEIALGIARDEAGTIGAELERGRIARVTDGQARAWLETDAEVWALVIKPWILVQEVACASGSTPTPVHG